MAKRDYAKEYREYQGTPEQLKNQSMRHKARRLMIKKHGKAAVAGKDIDHKDGNPRNNNVSNLRIMSKSENRSKK
jgi:hypothetical protein